MNLFVTLDNLFLTKKGYNAIAHPTISHLSHYYDNADCTTQWIQLKVHKVIQFFVSAISQQATRTNKILHTNKDCSKCVVVVAKNPLRRM